MVIGFDGATLELIRPWAEAGNLPTFQRLMSQGVSGNLQSTVPPVTPAAWSSLVTGLNQGKHGVFDFFGSQEDSYETYVVNATHRRGAVLWRLISQADRRVIVFNVPATYPPDQVNGLTLLDELRQAVPDFSFYPPGIFSQGQEAAFVEEVLAWDKMTLEATEYLMARQEWDFLFTVFIGIDIVSHFMWQKMVRGSALRDSDGPKEENPLFDAILRVYRQADEILARLLEMAGEDTYVLLVSDHGFGPLENYMHLNAWLEQRGYLKFKRTPAVLLKTLFYHLGLGGQVQETASKRNTWLKSLVKQVFLSLADVDWSRTTAYSAGYGGPIFVNLRGREPQGIVEPGSEYEALLARLITDLRALRHPDTDEPFVGEIYKPKDLYHGPYIELAPDLSFLPYDWRNQGYGVHDFASNKWLEPSPARTGTHRMEGILHIFGPGIRPGTTVEDAFLWDIAPTVLALMGVAIPKNMDGKVLSAAFSEELISRLSITYTETTEDPTSGSPETVLSEEEERVIRERLDALGYGG
jgi:predicted AlkP superfamily phosphohydrolase/phosphomutase